MQAKKQSYKGTSIAISSGAKTSQYFSEQHKYYQICLKVLEVDIEEMNKVSDISRNVSFPQIGNTRYNWSMEAFGFYHDNNIKVIDKSPFSFDINLMQMYKKIWRNEDCSNNFNNYK